jgi:epoxyqueuosine reductase
MSDPVDFRRRLQAEAHRVGFDGLGIAPAVAPPGYEAYRRWLADGHDAGMDYLRTKALPRSDPNFVLDGVRSIVMVAMIYGEADSAGNDPALAKIARYARGEDYHKIFWNRLDSLLSWMHGEFPDIRGRGVCDTAPLLERDYARLAGLGWIGKNTMLLSRSLGSFTLLGALLVDGELPYDPPVERGYCGTCTRCLDACPTQAFPAPYQLDANRCLSYWTIEHRGTIPDPVAENLNGWAFGCDICQDVCPWNRKAPPRREPRLAPRPGLDAPDLIGWLTAGPDEFAAMLRGSALKRAKRPGLLRNAALVLGGQRREEAVPALKSALSDPDADVRAACVWALGRIGTPEAIDAATGVADDEDPAVREALRRVVVDRANCDPPPAQDFGVVVEGAAAGTGSV